ncbi:hypothetical protein HY948_02715 [Candidatus Gottesmanbacteria bacterium]|nr:hypothetical protein [Candidatus Gottesmanbacteria bacterium]
MKFAIAVLLFMVIGLFVRLHWFPLAQMDILPDHPLYPVTVLRDRLMLRLIFDPARRIEYYLILSDRGVHASKALFEKGNIRLAKETVLKAEHYFTLLVTDYKWAVWRHTPISAELDMEIQRAVVRHRDIFQNMLDSVSPGDAAVFQLVIDFTTRNEQELLSVRQTNP